MSLCEIGLSEFDFRDCEPLPEPPEGRPARNRSIRDAKHTLRLVRDDKYYFCCDSAKEEEKIVGATDKLIGLHAAFKERLLDLYEKARKCQASAGNFAQSTELDRAYKHTAKCCLFSDQSTNSSSSSSGEASDSGTTSGSDSSRRRAIYRKQNHPARLHPDLWFNERGEMNDGPVCRCCWKARQRGVAHYIFAGEKPIKACDPLTNNRNRLYYYKLSVSPDINLTKEYSTTKIMYEGREFSFDGYGILCHSEVPATIPDRLMIRWNIEYKLSLEKEAFPEYFTVEDCCLFWQYFFVDLMELYDVNLLPSGSWDGCPTFHIIPRFVVKNSDNSIELLPMSAVLEHLLRSYELVFDPNAFASGTQWNDLVANLKGQLVSNPFKRPSSLRLDQIDRTTVVPDFVDGCYPIIVHFGVRPAVLTYNGNPEYQREYRKYLKFCRLIQLKPTTTPEDKNKMAEWKENLKIMKDKVSATRDVTIELSSKGFYKTGMYSDMVQHGLKLIVMFHHIRFHLSLRVLEQRLQYSFSDRALLELALTHPSYRPNYATNADHIRNTLSNCGLRRPEYGRKRIQGRQHRQRGIQKLIEVMSQMGCKTAKESEAMNNERLEFLGDAVIEFLTTIHLYYMFSDLEEGGLATFRSTLVQNNHLAVLARKIGLDEFMLYVHGPDLCHEEDLKHAMANAFEALLGALFLDGGIAVTDRVYGCTLFPPEEDENLHWIWFNPPLHPLQAEEPNGDRHLVDGIEILKNLTEFEDQIGIKFTHIRLLARAFTRKSVGYNYLTLGHNQRMEFLGDTVLQLITSEYLYKYFPTHQEGHLSLLRSCLVSNKTQAVICDDIGIPKFVNPPVPILPNNNYDLRTKDKADLVESFLGALFVDKGLEYCKLFCQLCFIPRLKHFILNQKWSDPKTRLQQSCIALRDPSGGEPEIPQYKVVSVEGPTNTRVYKVAVYFRNSRLAVGYGQSIKDAEIDAAETALHTKADMLPKILRRETCKAPKREASDSDAEKKKKVCSCISRVYINISM
ncbi:ribonuclease 3 [Trichuris trichiura]|uniref:Ribonuclease 3 n=1 Tax=Trichuris trichiura TaxID=36087 RepID=A0A077ZBS9_TRITR|nr:ribonuclease 3 [Trichuris trichiura]